MAKRMDLKDLNIYYGFVPGRGRRRADGAAAQRDRVHRPLRLRQVHRAAHPEPDARGDPRRPRAGPVLLDGEDIYGAGVDPVSVRRTIGMVFQRPNPFPTMSIWTTWRPG